MSSTSSRLFLEQQIVESDVRGLRVLEIGSKDVNGSIRPAVMKYEPGEYIGTDIEAGNGVDVIADAAQLVEHFGESRFDLVIASEMLEHVADWRTVISNMKRVTTENGYLVITTRSRGFPFHAFPSDYWRYEPEDMRVIFSDCEIAALENDPSEPGVFIKIRKGPHFSEVHLEGYSLYSILRRRRARSITRIEATVLETSLATWRSASKSIPGPIKTLVLSVARRWQ